MKNIVALFLVFASLTAMSQSEGLVSKPDPFTKKYLIKTERVRITATGINDGNSFSVALALLNDSALLMFSGNSSVHFGIVKGDKLVFLLDNDSTVSFVSPVNQSFYGINPDGASFPFDNLYLADTNKINMLINYPVKAVRMYYCGGYRYIENNVKSNLLPDFVIAAKAFMREYRLHKNPAKQP